MNKKIILIFWIVLSKILNGQVGINTDSPSRTLHVVGDLKVRQLADASDNALYNRILVTDANGNVDYVLKTNMLPTPEADDSSKESYSQLYNMTTESGNPDKILTCGKFYFLFDSGTDSNIKFRLIDNPGTTVNIFMSMEQNWTGNGYQFYQGKSSSDSSTVPFTFTTSNYDTPQEFASSNVADSEQNIMHFQYPNDDALYRLTIYRVKQKLGTPITNSWDFAATCEKF